MPRSGANLHEQRATDAEAPVFLGSETVGGEGLGEDLFGRIETDHSIDLVVAEQIDGVGEGRNAAGHAIVGAVAEADEVGGHGRIGLDDLDQGGGGGSRIPRSRRALDNTAADAPRRSTLAMALRTENRLGFMCIG